VPITGIPVVKYVDDAPRRMIEALPSILLALDHLDTVFIPESMAGPKSNEMDIYL
jgi:hypothetical protein